MIRDGLCWCGGTTFDAIGDAFGRCLDCATVVYRAPYAPDEFDRVGEDGSGFYGDAYWLEHVPEVDELPGGDAARLGHG